MRKGVAKMNVIGKRRIVNMAVPIISMQSRVIGLVVLFADRFQMVAAVGFARRTMASVFTDVWTDIMARCALKRAASSVKMAPVGSGPDSVTEDARRDTPETNVKKVGSC